MYYTLLTYLSINEHLSCFHFLATVKVLLQTFVYKFVCGYMPSFLFGLFLEVEWPGHMVTVCLTFSNFLLRN